MENSQKKTIYSIMRSLHRDIGFLTIGLLIVHVISGIDLIYRDKNIGFLRNGKQIEVKMMPDIKPENLKRDFRLGRIRDFKITRVEGEMVFFTGGSYNSKTGNATITIQESIYPFNKFIKIHKVMSKNVTHWINLLFAVSLLFLAISSFWMYKTGTKYLSRGIIFTLAGLVITVILIFV